LHAGLSRMKARNSEDKKRLTEAVEAAERALVDAAKEAAAPETHRFVPRLRTYFLTGLVVVGPIAITLYIAWHSIKFVDEWVKPLVPRYYNPETYLPFAVPGLGLIFAIITLTLIGALAANLIGSTLISSGEMFLDRMPIVRNLYRALKQIFESMISAADPKKGIAQVGLMEFPSKGIWSIVYVTGEAAGEIKAAAPGGETDHLIVWMPTGFMPPTGFVCVVPRKDVTMLQMSAEDAAKIVISAGLVMPDHQRELERQTRRGKKEKTPA
jgi:uncharacterized membrane protein